MKVIEYVLIAFVSMGLLAGLVLLILHLTKKKNDSGKRQGQQIPVGSAGDVFKYIFGLQWADPVNWANWIIDAFKKGLEIGTDVFSGVFFYLWDGDTKMFGVGKWFRDNIPDNPIKASNNSQVFYDICKPPKNYKGKAKMRPNGYIVFSGWSDQRKRAWATKYDVKWDDLSKAPNDWYAMQLFKKQDCYGMFCTENPGGGECVKGFCAKDDKGNIIPYVPFKWPKSNSAGIKLGTPTSKIYTDQQVCWNAANCVYDYNKPRTAENCPCGDP